MSTQQQNTASLRIEGEMTIYQAAEWKQAVLAALEAAPALDIDLSGVSEIDAAGVQILLLAKRTADAAAKNFRLSALSPAAAEVFQLLNLETCFHIPAPS